MTDDREHNVNILKNLVCYDAGCDIINHFMETKYGGAWEFSDEKDISACVRMKDAHAGVLVEGVNSLYRAVWSCRKSLANGRGASDLVGEEKVLWNKATRMISMLSDIKTKCGIRHETTAQIEALQAEAVSRPAQTTPPVVGVAPVAIVGALVGVGGGVPPAPTHPAITQWHPPSIPDKIDDITLARFVIDHAVNRFANVRTGDGTDTFVFDGKRYSPDKKFSTYEEIIRVIDGLTAAQTKILNNASPFRRGNNVIDNTDPEHPDNLKLINIEKYKNHNRIIGVEKAIDRITSGIVKVFDQDRSLFNTESGVLNVQTDQMMPHSPEFEITKMAPVEVIEGATDPETEALLKHMWPNQKTREYVEELFASSIFRRRFDENIFFIQGITADNGKTTITKALSRVFGIGKDGYCVWLNPRVFSEKRAAQSATQSELIAAKNACLAIIDEPDKSDLDINTLKNISNTGIMQIRDLYEKAKEMQWTCTLIMLCNRLPQLDTKDSGSARRPIVIPVSTKITPEMKNAPRRYQKGCEEQYGDYLFINEGPGIFNRLMRAYKRYATRGYRMPERTDEIKKATDDYIMANNTLLRFINERCTNKPLTIDGEIFPAYVNAKTFYNEYKAYCITDLEHDPKKIALPVGVRENMAGNGYQWVMICDKRNGRKSERCYENIALKPPDPSDGERMRTVVILIHEMLRKTKKMIIEDIEEQLRDRYDRDYIAKILKEMCISGLAAQDYNNPGVYYHTGK